MREHLSTSGRLIYYAPRHELEGLPGFHPTAGGRKARACCPIHRGDNREALEVDWATGWGHCFRCGDAWAIRVEDHPDTAGYAPTARQDRSGRAKPPKRSTDTPKPISDDLRARLQLACAQAAGRLAGSPGAAYLAGRGIGLETAGALGLGWVPPAARSPLRGRVVFPLTDPDGRPVSATGRAIAPEAAPKYRALAANDGYGRGLCNGGALAVARQTGRPVVVVEGPMDCAACVAGGVPLTVATGGVAVPPVEWFAGVPAVLIAWDADGAGQDRRRALMLALMAAGIPCRALAAAQLEGCKDLAEFWQLHRRMPPAVLIWATGPHMPPARTNPNNPDTRKGDTGAAVDPLAALTAAQLEALWADDDAPIPDPLPWRRSTYATPPRRLADARLIAEARAVAAALAAEGRAACLDWLRDVEWQHRRRLAGDPDALTEQEMLAAFWAHDLAWYVHGAGGALEDAPAAALGATGTEAATPAG